MGTRALRRLLPLAVVLLAAIPLVAVGCNGAGEGVTPSPVPTVSAAPPLPSATPNTTAETVSKALNMTRKLSGLDITLTMAHWTGDELVVEWVITNTLSYKFEKDLLQSIFTIGAAAVDQSGREGEYFIPERFQRGLDGGATIPLYETKWLLYSQSKTVTIRFRDLREPASGSSVDAVVEFVFSR